MEKEFGMVHETCIAETLKETMLKVGSQSSRSCGKWMRVPIQIHGQVSAVIFSSRIVHLLRPPFNVFE